eukprot:Skav217703  [mRNA]  locus=scaffold2294:90003:97141:- [translate_table: standard]
MEGEVSSSGTSVPGSQHLPYHLIPAFVPGETDLNEYSRRLEFLAGIWPAEQLSLLAPRAALMCKGSAFQKVTRVDPAKLKQNSVEGIKLIVKTLGGVYGKTVLEDKYEKFERAIFQTTQKGDESNESYLARHEVLFEDAISAGATLDTFRSYILLRNSASAPEDKKRVVVEAGGELKYGDVTKAIRMLGSRFFQEVQGSRPTSKTKTYEINMTQEADEEAFFGDEYLSPPAEPGEISDQMLELLVAEGDEDAILMGQFEEALIDTVQADQEMNIFMTSYLEARRRLAEKTKVRGFWPVAKGQSSHVGGKKGRGKGWNPMHRGRKPLAQRIAESSCRLCGAKGHWKAECPKRNQIANGGTSKPPTSAATMVAVSDPVGSDADEDEADVFVLASDIDRSMKDWTRWKHEGFPSDKTCRSPLSRQFYNRVRDRMHHIMTHVTPANAVRKPTVEAVHRTGTPSEQKLSSENTLGILDLGASQTVMGQHQVEEFLQGIPLSIRERIFEKPVNMTFRFGNNSTVPCKKAMFIPVGHVWIKIAIVDSRTPFLISNNVCRNLGAIIDTEKNTIHFRKLNQTLSLSLSPKKLFLLDFCALLQTPDLNQSDPCRKNAAVTSDTVLMHDSDSGPSLPIDIHDTHGHTTHPHASTRNISQVSSVNEREKEDGEPTQSSKDLMPCNPIELSRPNHSSAVDSPVSPDRHVSLPQELPGRSLHGHPGHEEISGEPRQVRQDVLQPASEPGDQVWSGQAGRQVSSGGARRPIVLPGLPEEVRPIDQAGTSRVCSLPASMDGEDGAIRGQGAQCSTTSGGLGRWRGCWESIHRSRSIRRPSIGCGVRGGQGIDYIPNRSTRDSAGTGHHPVADSELSSSEPRTGAPVAVATQEQADFIRQCIHAYNMEHYGFVQDTMMENPLRQEMKEYMRNRSLKSSPARHVGRLDLLEIYCSSDSQLTKQALRSGLRAMRFGLAQGDLSTYEGRCRLYDLLLSGRPKHVWVSPKCKAWCRWNQFNASRSPAAAQRVMEAQAGDLVHLQLCDAVLEHQLNQGSGYHFHLEQPVGSAMIYQEHLDSIHEHTIRTRCDFCTAGDLKHPETGQFLQKGTQILTTSELMHRYLDALRCSRQHEHDHVAGSYRDRWGHRHTVSSYTELYTAAFASKVVRTMQVSEKCQEDRIPIAAEGLVEEANRVSDMPEAKRRRLNAKSSPSMYEPLAPNVESSPSTAVSEPDLKHLTRLASEIAPRVGKLVCESGPFFNAVCQQFPEKIIRLVEIAKGTDRFRKPPIKFEVHEAPLRRTFGIHRHTGEVFDIHDWIPWHTLSGRQMQATSPPARIMPFLGDRTVTPVFPIPKPKRSSEQPDIPSGKRFKVEHDGSLDEKTPCSDQGPEVPHGSIKQHGPKFRRLSAVHQSWIQKVHKNLGHPGTRKLQRVLQQQGYPAEIVDGVEDFRCDTCFEMQQPKTARPATLSEEREFNDCVGADLVTWTSAQGQRFQFIHFVDAATNFQQAFPVFQTDAEALFEAFQSAWLHWAGPCKQLVIDNESGLCSDHFAQLTQSQNIYLRPVAAYAHWQLGKTERHGDILQHMLSKLDHDQPVLNATQFRQVLQHCCVAKNALARAKGFTPEILVLGKSLALPGSLSDNPISPAQYLASSDTPEGIAFRAHLEMREKARQAFLSADNSDKLRRAILRKHTPHRGLYQSGTFVMFWRPGRGEAPGTWSGPARVIVQESEHVIWLSHSSRVYRVAPEHVRMLSEREASDNTLNLHQQQDLSLPPSVGNRGVFQYEDLSEAVPPGPPVPEVAEPESPDVPAPESNESQPDAEPGNAPGLSEYAPTTPANSTQSPAEPSPLEAHEIPIPTDDDELMMDFWVQRHNTIHRVHCTPRTHAFNPCHADDCPVDLLTIGDSRSTHGHAVTKASDSQPWLIHDQWAQNDADWSEETSWVGVTSFEVTPTESPCPEEPADVYLFQQAQGLSCEIYFTQSDLQKLSNKPEELEALMAAAAKRQRSEVKVRDLTEQELKEFEVAKNKEIDQWLSTQTVQRILRSKVPQENVLRCRWVLNWKELDPIDAAKEGRPKRAKARLVVLGYEDPGLCEIPRDSPTVQRESRSLVLQYCASRRWAIGSFDVKTAFLRGSRRDSRVLAIEPPAEMRSKMHLESSEICELLKSAYGLVNAPYLWFQEIREALQALGFVSSPLDPCLFSLSSPEGQVHGLIALHVDDGLYCGDTLFHQRIQKLQEKYPFGSQRSKDFTFTGIHIRQDEDFHIHLDQHDYIMNIDPISIDRNRRKQEQLPVSEAERQCLRGVIGSLQYASTNTRPDLSARLSFLQSKIPVATIHDLLEAHVFNQS